MNMHIKVAILMKDKLKQELSLIEQSIIEISDYLYNHPELGDE